MSTTGSPGRLALPLAAWALAAACLAALAAGCGRSTAPPAQSGRGRVRIAAASDLNAALGEIIARFSAAQHVDVSVSYGSSGAFYNQLLNRAPFDLFLSADVGYARELANRELTNGRDFPYAIGRLVLWAPASSTLDVAGAGIRALADPSVARVAIANPDHAPYGRAAVAALRHAGIYDAVQGKLAYGESVAQAMQFAQSGAADAGLVAMALAVAPGVASNGRWFEVPASDYPRLEQSGVILQWAQDADAARAFQTYLTGPDGRAVLQQYGFALPDR